MTSSTEKDIKLLKDVYRAAGTVMVGESYITVNELTDQVPAVRPEVMIAAVRSLMALGPILATKILSEDDKGAILAGMFGVWTMRPLAMARPLAYLIPGTYQVPLKMEYGQGTLTVNGVEKGDKVCIVDDTLATGGTIIALAKAVAAIGAEVVDIRVVVEKLDVGGRARLKKELDIDVKAVFGIHITPTGIVRVAGDNRE